MICCHITIPSIGTSAEPMCSPLGHGSKRWLRLVHCTDYQQLHGQIQTLEQFLLGALPAFTAALERLVLEVVELEPLSKVREDLALSWVSSIP